MSRRLLALLLAFGLVFVASACGGSDSSDESSQEATSGDASERTAERPATRDSDDGDDGADDSGSGRSSSELPDFGQFGDLGYCMELSMAMMTLFLGPMAFMGAMSEDEIAEFEEMLGDVKATIPAELRDDWDTVSEAYDEFFSELGTIDWEENPGALFDPALSERLEEASANLDSAEVQDALERISDFLERECGDIGAGSGF